METIIIDDDQARGGYLEEQILLTVIKLLELHFTPEEIILALLHRITVLWQVRN